MSEREYNKQIGDELRWLNMVIDRKILRGLDYKEESKRHRDLLKKQNTGRVMPRAYSFMTFLF